MKIETKLSIGDTGYFMSENVVCWDKVDAIKITVDETKTLVLYDFDGTIRNEVLVFPTKQALLESL